MSYEANTWLQHSIATQSKEEDYSTPGWEWRGGEDVRDHSKSGEFPTLCSCTTEMAMIDFASFQDHHSVGEFKERGS